MVSQTAGSDNLLLDRQEATATITINRPAKLNALNLQVMTELGSALDALEEDPSTRVVVLTGAGNRAFVAGADIEQLSKMGTPEIINHMTFGHQLFLRIAEYPKPTIAMVNGYALGGGFELALSCDLLVASDKAVFGFPEINLNTMPGWGGTQLAARKMGLNRAMEMVFTGAHYPVERCVEFGFINRLAPADELRQVTLHLARTLAEKNPFALKMAKSALRIANELPLSAGMRYETLAYATNFGSPHAQEGFDAFLGRSRR